MDMAPAPAPAAAGRQDLVFKNTVGEAKQPHATDVTCSRAGSWLDLLHAKDFDLEN